MPVDGLPGVPPEPIPLTILTGFLGSGKTIVLNRLLKDPAMAQTLVIVNEFGEIGIDHQLIETIDSDLVLLSSGCLCCTIRGDLIGTLESLLRRLDNKRMPRFRRIVIETTGLADPAPILHTVMGHPYLQLRYRLEGVVTLVDAVNGLSTLEHHPEAAKQAAVADRLIVSKADLVDRATLDAVKAALRTLNPVAPLLSGTDIGAADVLECGLYNPDTKKPDVRRWLNEEALAELHGESHAHRYDEADDPRHGHDPHHGHHPNHGHDHHSGSREGQSALDLNRHGRGIRAFSFRSETPVSRRAFDLFCELLRSAHGEKLLRLKGLVRLAEDPDHPIVVHGVQHVFHPPAALERWPDADHATRMVFIVQGLDRAFVEQLWAALTPSKPA